MLDLTHEYLAVLVEEWCDADEHFINKDAYGPPINSFVVSCMADHFWGEILGCTAVGHGHFIGLKHLCETIVNDLNVARLVDHDILKFQVSVHNAFCMELSNCNNDLCGIKFDNFFRESLLLLKDFVQLTTVNEWHNEVKAGFRLK